MRPWARRMPAYDRGVAYALNEAPDARRRQAADDVALRVKSELIALLDQGAPRLETIARRLNMPSWTLRRRLAESGVNFTDMVELTRRELALYYLEQRQVTISELSALLGYAEVSALSRAFHRWYGASPRQWRSSAGGKLFG